MSHLKLFCLAGFLGGALLSLYIWGLRFGGFDFSDRIVRLHTGYAVGAVVLGMVWLAVVIHRRRTSDRP